MGMKPPMNEACEPIRNAVTTAKKMGDNAPIRNAGTQRGGGLNEQSNIKNSATPDPKKAKKGQGY